MGRDAESGAGTGERPRPGGPSQSPAAGDRAGTHRAYGAECDGDGAAGRAGGRGGRAGRWGGGGGGGGGDDGPGGRIGRWNWRTDPTGGTIAVTGGRGSSRNPPCRGGRVRRRWSGGPGRWPRGKGGPMSR